MRSRLRKPGFLSKRRSKRSRHSLRNVSGSGSQVWRASAVEPLEDRRLLAAEVAVSLAAPSEIEETANQQLVFTFSRDDSSSALTAQFEIAGTALAGVDFIVDEQRRDTIRLADSLPTSGPVRGTVVFEAGKSEVQLLVQPIPDTEIERDEQVSVTVVGTDLFGSVRGAAAKIQDDVDTEYYVVDGFNRLGIVDIDTGAVDVLGDIDAVQTIRDIAFTETGELFAISSDHLFQVDPEEISNGFVETRFLGFHGIRNANALIDARDDDFGSDTGDLFAAGQDFLDLQWIDLERFEDEVFLNNVVTVFDIDGALAANQFPHQFFSSGDLDYDSGGDLILSAFQVGVEPDSLIEIKTPGDSGFINAAPKAAEDPGVSFSDISGLAFDGIDSFGFTGHSMLRVNQFNRDSKYELNLTGIEYVVGSASSATGTILGDPVDPPTITFNHFPVDPSGHPGRAVPTTWAEQNSMIVDLFVQLGATVDEIPLSEITLTNLGVQANDAATTIALDESQLTFQPGTDFFSLHFQPSDLPDGRYELTLGRPITSGPEFVFRGDRENRFFVMRSDWDGNALVDIRDFETYAYWFGSATPSAPLYADLNLSGMVEGGDFAGIASQLGKQVALPGTPPPISAEWISQSLLDRAFAAVINPLDVNGVSGVTPLDALFVLNRLSSGTETVLDWRYDVNRDGVITPRDALRVINELTRQSSIGGESEEIEIPLQASESGQDALLNLETGNKHDRLAAIDFWMLQLIDKRDR